jgi:hypothetical protein
MLTKLAYAFYEAGAAVAAIHLKLLLRQVSINAARGATDVVIARENAKARITLWLTGLAAEKKGVGETDPFRRIKVRQRIAAEILEQSKTRRGKGDPAIVGQAQDRANAICSTLMPAIQKIAERLVNEEVLATEDVEQIVGEVKRSRQRRAKEN